MTLLLSISVMSFGIRRFHIMVHHINSNISEDVLVDYFDISQQFNSKNEGLYFAFGISSFWRKPQDNDDDPDYGHVEVKYELWDD